MRSQLAPLEGRTVLVQRGHQVMVAFQAASSQPCVIWGLSSLQEQDHRLYTAVNPCLFISLCSCSLTVFSLQPCAKGCFLCPDPLCKSSFLPFAPLSSSHWLPVPSPTCFLPTAHCPCSPLGNVAEYVMVWRRIISGQECM